MTAKQPPAPREGGVPAVPPTPIEILGMAVQEGKIDAASLKVLAELTWKKEDRDSRKEFNAALVSFRKACPAIEKTEPGPVLAKDGSGEPAYWYAPIEVLEPTVRPVLTERGFAYSWDSQVDGGLITATFILLHENGHERRASFTCPTDNPSPKMTGQQKYGGGLKFAMRKSMEALLGIVEEGVDVDGQGVPQDVETITDKEAADLEAFADEAGADKPRFLKWLRAGDFDQIAKADHDRAIKALARKKEQEG